jgi:hypothetical protein
VRALLAILLTSCMGCGSNVPQPVTPALHSELAAAISLTKDLWLAAANACLAADPMPAVCESVMPATHDSILAAAAAVDAMPVGATVTPQAAVCALSAASAQLSSIPGVTLPTIVPDVLAVVAALGTCTTPPAPAAPSPVPSSTPPVVTIK